MEEDEAITIEVMKEVVNIIVNKCEKYEIENKTEAIKTIGENLVMMTEICNFDEYKSKED